MTLSHPIVFLVDVDNTLLDNDGIQQDLKDHLECVFGRAARKRYWRILEDLFAELGYRDYIGALQRYRVEHPYEVELLSMSSVLMDYPFTKRLFPSTDRAAPISDKTLGCRRRRGSPMTSSGRRNDAPGSTRNRSRSSAESARLTWQSPM
jgi:hypothetical protein